MSDATTPEEIARILAKQLCRRASGGVGQCYYLADFKPTTATTEVDHSDTGTVMTDTYIFNSTHVSHPKAFAVLLYGIICALGVQGIYVFHRLNNACYLKNEDNGMVVLSLEAPRNSSDIMAELWYQQLSTYHHIVNHDSRGDHPNCPAVRS